MLSNWADSAREDQGIKQSRMRLQLTLQPANASLDDDSVRSCAQIQTRTRLHHTCMLPPHPFVFAHGDPGHFALLVRLWLCAAFSHPMRRSVKYVHDPRLRLMLPPANIDSLRARPPAVSPCLLCPLCSRVVRLLSLPSTGSGRLGSKPWCSGKGPTTCGARDAAQ